MIRPLILEKTLGKQLLAYILLVSSVFAIIATFLQLWVDYSKDVDLIENRILQLQQTYLSSLSLSLWNMDDEHIQTLLDGIIQLPEISYIELKTFDYTYKKGEKPEQLIPMVIKTNIIFQDPFEQLDPQNVGVMHIYGNLEHVYERLQSRFLIILGVQTIKTFSVSIFILFIFWALITRHLKAIATYTRNLSFKNLKNTLNLNRRQKGQDELDAVVEAINEMRINLIHAEEESQKDYRVQRELNQKLMVTIENLEAAESVLKQQERQYRTLVNNIPGAIFRSYGENRWELNIISKAISEISGYDHGKFIGMDGIKFSSIVYKNDLASIENVIESALQSREPYIVEYRIEHASGQLRWVYEKGQGIYSSSGELLYLDGVIFDISERKQAQEMLIQTEKLMSLGALAAGVAHEINNPLGVVLMGVQNIIRRISPKFIKNARTAKKIGVDLVKMNEYMEERQILSQLNSVKASGERASKIVSHMLQFARSSQSRSVTTDIRSLLDRSLELAENDYNLKKKMDFRSIRIIKDYATDLPPINCIETEIEQVLLNLFSNSAYSLNQCENKEDATIWIRTYKVGKSAQIEVEDNGEGMSDETMRRVFDPFYTTKPVGQGTGLGLSVSYKIIEQNHGGSITVESELNKGTKIIIVLPYDFKPATQDITDNQN